MDKEDVLMEVFKIKHAERINYVDNWVKSLQIFITVGITLIAAAVYSKEYILLVILPFLEFCMYLMQAVFVWIIFLTDEISFRAIIAINSSFDTDLFSSELSDPGPLKDLDIYASTEYAMMDYKKYVALLGNGVIGVIYLICSIFGIIYIYNYLNHNLAIALILSCIYAFFAIVMIAATHVINKDKSERREKNRAFMNSKRLAFQAGDK
jgi:hypothetical protein